MSALPPVPPPPPIGIVAPVASLVGQLGGILGGQLGSVGKGAQDMAGKIADLTGMSGIGGQVEESVGKIREFANEQVDALLNGAISATKATVDFAEEVLRSAATEAGQAVEKVATTAKDALRDVDLVPQQASQLLKDAEQIKGTALERRDALKKHAQRFRERRQKLPKIISQHFEEFSVELEEELELDAKMAEELGEKTEKDSRAFYDKTVKDAEHYGTLISTATKQNLQRGKRIKNEIAGGIASSKQWAGDQVKKVGSYKSERMKAAQAIGTPIDAKNWATESIEGAHRLVSEIKTDVERKPGEIRSFGQKRIDEANELAQGVRQEVEVAQTWLKTQRGNNASWKRAMRENRQTTEAFLTAQGARVAMKVSEHGSNLRKVGKELSEEQYKDTAGELGKTVTEAKRTFDNVTEDVQSDKKIIGEDLGKQVINNLPEPTHGKNQDFRMEIEFPEDEPEPTEGPLAMPEMKVAQPAKGKLIAQEKEAKAAANPEKEKAKSAPPANADKKAPANPGKETVAKPAQGPAQNVPTVNVNQPEEQVAEKKTPATKTVPEKTPQKASTAAPSNTSTSTSSATSSSPAPAPAPAAQAEEKKAKVGSNTPDLDSKVSKGMSIPKIDPAKAQKETAKKAAPAGSNPAEGTPQNEATGKKESAAPSASMPASKPGKPAEKAKEAVDPDTNGVGKATGAKKMGAKVKSSVPKDPLMPKSGAPVQTSKTQPDKADDPKMFLDKLKSVSGPGEAPDSSTRSTPSKHIGFDPKMVRFHHGPIASMAASALGAEAFTIGKDVFFGAGKFDLKSPQGLGLAAHEATHVGQQMGLKGPQMRFSSKAGGDDMEQEAQEIGERVATNLSYSAMLSVAKYVRIYEPEDDEPLSASIANRLDRLSTQALRVADRILGTRTHQQPQRLDEVTVNLSLDLEEMTDTEIVEAWSEAIISAIEAATPVAGVNVAEEAGLDPSTHLVQRRLGDPSNEPVKTEVKVDPEVMARIAKITASAQDKDMIRKLLVRKDVDPYLKSAQTMPTKPNPSGGSLPTPNVPHHGGGGNADRAFVDEKLKEVGINSIEEYEKLKKDWVNAFEAKGVNVVNFLLEENLKVVLSQKNRYLANQKGDPNSPINTIKVAAKEVQDSMGGFISAVNNFLKRMRALGAPSIPDATTSNLDTTNEMIRHALKIGGIKPEKEESEAMSAGFNHWEKVRRQHGDKHVILLGRDFDPAMVTGAENEEDLMMKLFHKIEDTEKSIRYAQGEMSPAKFWELPDMVNMTKKQMGVQDGDGAGITIKEVQDQKATDALLWGIIQAAAAIALAVTAMVATGGLAAVAMIGSAGLSVYSAAKATDDYMFKSAAVNSSLDQAKLLSKDDPSFLWLALELIGAGLDVAGAVGAFGKLAKAFKAFASDKEALKQLEEAVRDAYKSTKGLAISEDDFVARFMEVAKKGAPDPQTFAKQVKLATELLEGTSARAVGILKGDRAAIQATVTEYGNWKGLIGSLSNGGGDASKMATNIGAWRNEIVADLKARGAAPLEDASTKAISDFDMNVVAKDGQGAGERLLAFEKEMAGKYGKNWSEALLMNFYTEKSRLMAVDEIMNMVPAARRAEIMTRVSQKAEKLNFAKMLEHAGSDPKARQQVLELMESAGVKYSLAELDAVIAGLAGKDKEAARAAKLLEVDAKVKEMDKLPPKDPKRIAKAEEVTMAQMEANFLTKEAYISPGALKGGDVSNAELYNNALSQLEMISHVIHECGGDIVKASREYELHKYINRYVTAAKKAGLESPSTVFFENYTKHIYKDFREANRETAHLPGATDMGAEGTAQAVNPEFLLGTYNDFRNEVKSSLPKMKQSAEANPTGIKRADPKSPSKVAPAAAEAPPSVRDYTKPGGVLDPAKAAGLPAATVKTADAADKMLKDKKGAGKTGILSNANAINSGGFGSDKAMQGIGMFKTHIPGVPKEVIVTVMPAEQESQFKQQLAAAIAAASTGLGPKVHGKVDVGEKKLGFAMDTVEGGFADAYNNKDNAADNKLDMLRNAQHINGTTFNDVEGYRHSIWDAGIRYTGPVEGFVAADGHWRPINFAATSGFQADTVLTLARQQHDAYFDRLKGDLMQNSIAAKKKLAEEGKK